MPTGAPPTIWWPALRMGLAPEPMVVLVSSEGAGVITVRGIGRDGTYVDRGMGIGAIVDEAAVNVTACRRRAIFSCAW
jgi:hypothetical protein